jgi:hypothetical protein
MGSREELRITIAKHYGEIEKIAKEMKDWGCGCEDVCAKDDFEHNAVFEKRRLIVERLHQLVAEYVKLSMEF